MARKRKQFQSALDQVAKAAVPALFLAQPGVASVRTVSRAHAGIHTQVCESQARWESETPTTANDPFAPFCSKRATPVVQSAAVDEQALQFLQENGFLSQSDTVASELSGDLTQLAGRKSFASCTVFPSVYVTRTACTSASHSWNSGGNNAPTNIGLDNTNISDSATGSGALVGNLNSTDADGGDTHTYGLVSNGASGSGSCGAAGDDDNASFQVDNANDHFEAGGSLAPGGYSVCIQTHDGTDSYQKTFTITVTDGTAPSFESGTPVVSSIGLTGATLSVDLNEEGTVYYVVVADGAGAPSSAQVKAGQNSGGGAPLVSGNFSTSGTTGSEAFSGLSSATAYDLYVVAEDDEGTPNQQPSATLVNFTSASPDSDGDLVAAGSVTEPVGLGSTVDTVGEAVDLFDFTLSDGGTSDGLALTVSQIVVNVSGSSTDSERGQITWRLNGNDASNVTGVYSAGADTLTFSGLSISIADGGSETYTINGYFNDNSNLTEDLTVIFSIDGDTDVTTGGSGSQMAATSAVTNSTGTTLDVTATSLAFTTQPSGSTSGSTLTTQPVVTARDAFGNTDVDFTETVTLSEASAGSLSGDVDIAAVSGVATFTDVAYSATADQQSFTLTANDQDGVGTNLSTVDANSVTADVVATQLVFTTQPVPLTVNSGEVTAFTTVPVVAAQDANNVVDTGYSTDISLAEVNGGGSAIMTGTGDTDGNGATVSITPSSGVSTFTGLNITYSASGGSSETFNLQASSGGLSTANSSQLTGLVADNDGDLTASAIVTEPVNLNFSADMVGEAVDLFDFTLSDGGSADGLPMTVSSLVVNLSGTSSDTERSKITWRLNGNDASNVVGVYSAGADTLTFSGLSISIADGTSETYSINGYYNDNSGITHGSSIILTLDGDTDLSLGGSGTQMGSTSALTNGSGTLLSDDIAPSVSSVSLPANATYVAGNNLDFTVNTDENITVSTAGGTPRLALTIGSTTRYANYLSGSGSSAMVFRYSVQSGDLDSDGISLNGTLDLNGGTLQDVAGNDLTTSLGTLGSLASVLVDAQAPSLAQVTAVVTPGSDATPAYTFSTDEAGTLTVGGSCGSGEQGAVSSGNNSISLTQTDNSTALSSGAYSDCTLTVTDAAGNSSAALAVNTFVIDLAAPSGHSLSFDDAAINSTESTGIAFTFAGAEVGADYSYTISSSGGGSNVTGSGTLSTATDQVSSVDISSLGDGTLTLSAVLTDTAGNAASAVTHTAVLDATAPTLSGTSPVDDAIDVQFDATITLEFNESIAVGSGDISLFNAADDSLVEAIAVGSATLSGSDLSLTPSGNFTPTQSYYVQVAAGAVTDATGNDFAGINDNSTFNFTVTNNAPVGVADSATTNEDEGVDIDVLANDSDQDSSLNPASVTITNPPSNGSTSINTGTGVITYTPDVDYNGSDSFSYQVEDLYNGATADTAVSVSITPVNDAPVAVADVTSTPEDTAVDIDVADNDSDVDTGDGVDTATLVVVSAPANGSAVVSAGQISYTPDANYSGSDSFTYTIDDQNGATSNQATVMINISGVNDAPVAVDDSASSDEDTPVTLNLVANDTDVDGTVDPTSITLMVQPSNGSVSLDGTTGEATYTPNQDFNGTDSFTYVVQDDDGASSAAGTVTLTIAAVNDAPVAAADTVSVQEDTPYSINVLGNDTDVDGTLQSNTLELVDVPQNGSAVVSAGMISYTPGEDYNGSDSLTYRVQDDLGEWSNTATVTITVQSINDAPLANNDSATTDEDQTVVIPVLENDTDVDGSLDLSTITIDSAPVNGSLVDNGDGTLSYTPDADSNGSDSFAYSVLDNEGASSNSATVTVTVQAVNDAPLISGTPATEVLEGASYSFIPTLTDIDSSSLSVSATNLPAWASVDPDTGALSGAPQVGDAGDYSDILLTVTDGSENSSLAAFSIQVIADFDTDGTPNTEDADDDNDGMSDEYEETYGFNPLDSSDAAADADGDTISNLQESLDNTDPADSSDYTDTTAPVINPPADLVLDAVALFTPVTLSQLLDLSTGANATEITTALNALTTDNVDGTGCCATEVVNLSNNQLLLAPGTNSITYRASDRKGNEASATQLVHVRPLISVNKDQVSVEGARVQFKVILNGTSPFYPLTIPYLIDTSNSSADSADHDLVDGSLTLTEGQTSASVSIQLASDSLLEGNETLVVVLDDRTSNAQDLANGYDPQNPDIFDINSGAKVSHQITIAETNIAPEVSLRMRQGLTDTIQVTPDGGTVTITATVTDPNLSDTHILDWSASDESLTDTDGDTGDTTLMFDPSGLSVGRYRVAVNVTDGNGASDTAALYFQLVADLPLLGTNDTDGDGIDDANEGTADSDDDGIPDYLDNAGLAPNVLPEVATEPNAFLLECEPGVRCRLGQFALLAEGGGALLNDADLAQQDDIQSDERYQFSGGIFDFEIQDLPTLGQSVQVVLPQTTAIPANAVYRKFADGQWSTFVESAVNEIHSSAGSLGYCPPPGDSSWEPGLVAGYFCVQLTIEDGGPNDADGLMNGAVEDPGAVGTFVPLPADTEQTFDDLKSTGKGSGGGGALSHWLLLVLGVGLLMRARGKLKSQPAAKSLPVMLLAASLTLTPSQRSHATSLDEVLAQSYVSVSASQARTSLGQGDFVAGMAEQNVAVDINYYDIERIAYQFTLGYAYHQNLALELGYLDLRDVEVDMDATGTPNNLMTGLNRHYPMTGEGWTLANRFRWMPEPAVTLSAELGVFLWEGKISGAGVSADLEGGEDPLLGLAAHYRVAQQFNVGVHAKRIWVGDQTVDLFGLELKFMLKPHK